MKFGEIDGGVGVLLRTDIEGIPCSIQPSDDPGKCVLVRIAPSTCWDEIHWDEIHKECAIHARRQAQRAKAWGRRVDFDIEEDICQVMCVSMLEGVQCKYVPKTLQMFLAYVARSKRVWRLLPQAKASASFEDDAGNLPTEGATDPGCDRKLPDAWHKNLSDKQRSLLRLRYVEGFSGVQLASVAGRTESAISQQVLRAIALCQEVA